MFYGEKTQDTRQVFFSSWKKYKQNDVLLPLEKQIIAVILDHPEYHSLLESAPQLDLAYFPELGQTNPFLHMGLHLAIRDQLATDRPVGINKVYKQLLQKYNDNLAVEHLLMEGLAESLWLAQRNQAMVDEIGYLNACRKLL